MVSVAAYIFRDMESTSCWALPSRLLEVPADFSEMHILVFPCPDGALLGSEGYVGPSSELMF